MPDDIPDFVMRALIDDRLTQLRADQDTELEDYLATLPTPIHLIVDLPELDGLIEREEDGIRVDQRALLYHETAADSCRRQLADRRIRHRELINRRRGLESNV